MIGRGDLVALVDGNGRRFILRVEDELKEYNFGIYNAIKLLGHSYGSSLRIGSVEYTLFRPGIVDIISSLKRKTQIITPKDIGTIIINCNIIPGAKVVEGGVGTGALTVALASFVSPNGKVIGYENKLENIEIAKKNIISVGLDELVLIKEKDIKEGIDEEEVDAVILDIPDPWEVIKHAYKALKQTSYFCSFSPNTYQVEKTVNELNKFHFREIKTFENIQREIEVLEFGTRPSFKLLGHTGYITFARKVG